MPPKEGQTKKAKIAAATSASKRTAKKWNRGQTREPLQNAVMFDKETLTRLRNDIPKYKLITPFIISDRLKISVSLASAALMQLCREKKIRLVSCSSKHRVYTRIVMPAAPAATPAPAQDAPMTAE